MKTKQKAKIRECLEDTAFCDGKLEICYAKSLKKNSMSSTRNYAMAISMTRF